MNYNRVEPECTRCGGYHPVSRCPWPIITKEMKCVL